MGWILDAIFCVLIGLGCVFLAHFIFRTPYTNGNIKILFILGCLGWALISYMANDSDSRSHPIWLVVGLIVGAGLVYFFIFPMMSDIANGTKEVPARTISTLTSDSTTRITQTTSTPIEYFSSKYQWTFNHYSYTYSLKIPKPLYEYYRKQTHDRDYAKYAINDNDRKVLDKIISSFREKSDSKTDAAYNIVAFVQSIPYSKDYLSTGFNEYPRYPIETLVDGTGDCEDTAILTAALLKEMNYDVVLISPPGHMAIGITCSDCSGTYYVHDGKKYFYLETTENNWRVGEIPSSYKNQKVKVYSI